MKRKPIGENSKFAGMLPDMVQNCEALRRDQQGGIDVTLAEYVQETHQLSMEQFYQDLGIDPTRDSIQLIVNLPDRNMRWLIPEIFRDAIRLGLRKAPIYPNFIAGEQTVSQLQVTMPAINMSDAVPMKVGVAEIIPLGDVSFDQKTSKIYKYGRGIKVPYEVIQYVALNVVGLFMQDMGVKMGMGLDAMMIAMMINGDQAGGIDSAPTIGIATANSLTFRDLLKLWVRGARLGKQFTNVVGGETMGMDILDLLTTTKYFGQPRGNVTLTVKSPIPTDANYWIHGSVPDQQAIFVDNSSALLKLNAQPLLVETDKIIQDQTQETYCTFQTGFVTMYKDSRIIMDETLAFGSGHGFPTYMDPTSQETQVFL